MNPLRLLALDELAISGGQQQGRLNGGHNALRSIARGTAGALGATLALLSVAYLRDIRRAYARVRGKSSIISTPYGDVEYTERGAGPPVLVVHGSGGGYDQGELIVDAFLGDHFHCITPSRFGYLRSTFHKAGTFDDQAHAFASLLDHLGLDRVAVVAFSHGGPSALLFAILYPHRVTSLTLVSAGVVTLTTGEQGEADQKGNALVTIFQHDWLYWAIASPFKKQFMGLMGAGNDVITTLTLEQRRLVERVIEQMNPASSRAAGAAFDNQAALPGVHIAAIRAPTLIFHATDDTLQRFQNAEFAAATIPNAQLVRFERGGHLLMAVEQALVRQGVQEHIISHAGE